MPVWIEAMEMAESVFRLSDILPKKEDYGLTSQLRRSALSVSGNIAEVFGRYHLSDKINFYYFSRGSLAETMIHLEYGKSVGYFKPEDVNSIHPMLEKLYESINRIIKSLKVKYKTGIKP
jgi:four helix bundle protein